MSLEQRDAEVFASLGTWRKGQTTVRIELEGEKVKITPFVGNPFFVSLEEWPARKARIEEEGWTLDQETVEESDFIDEAESAIRMRESARPTFRATQGYETGMNIPRQPSLPTNLGQLPEGVYTDPPPTMSQPPRDSVEIPEDVTSKILIPPGAVLRRKDGMLFLMTRQEGGWENFAFPVESEDKVAEKFNVRLGQWGVDEHGEFCPVTKSPIKVVLKPPRPSKTG